MRRRARVMLPPQEQPQRWLLIAVPHDSLDLFIGGVRVVF